MSMFKVTECTFVLDEHFHKDFKFKVEFSVSLELMIALKASGDGLDLEGEIAQVLGRDLVEVILANMGKISEPTNGFISLDVLMPALKTAGMRLIKRKLEVGAIRIWIHLNDLRFADLDAFAQNLATHGIALDEDYEGDINELRLVIK